jgi:hypothetical protein
MSALTVVIVGEAWEAPFARATALSLVGRIPADAEVLVPAELARAVHGILPNAVCAVAPAGAGFASYPQLRDRVTGAARTPTLVLAAGVVARDETRRAASAARYAEWNGPGTIPLRCVLEPPLHRPPARRRHRRRRIGALDVWDVDGGERYFQALPSFVSDGVPVWAQYGPRTPVFARNTNDFDEPAPPRRAQYAILAAGLLGLRLIIDSDPLAGAPAVVYDINPDQLDWLRFVLARASEIETLDRVVEGFALAHPAASVRTVEPHERDNAQRQSAWYARNRMLIAALARRLEWHFVRCDVLTQPAPLFDALDPARSTLLMYLDLFVVWHVDAPRPWVERHAGMALSFERLARERLRGEITFVPGPRSKPFQLAPQSPFLEGHPACT